MKTKFILSDNTAPEQGLNGWWRGAPVPPRATSFTRFSDFSNSPLVLLKRNTIFGGEQEESHS
jgi:hypothetical protein